MKQQKFLSALAIFALVTVAADPAEATVVQTIPYSAGIPFSGSNCGANTSLARGYAQGPSTPNHCLLDFPLSLPVGYIITQIGVLHSASYFPTVPHPYISAFLSIEAIATPWNVPPYANLYWSSTNAIPPGTVARQDLMGPADFLETKPNRLYHITVELGDGAVSDGLQITYETCLDCL